MNIIERGRQFVQSLRELANRSLWDWRRCPHCGSRNTIKNGGYWRHPWFLDRGRQEVRVQRHLCHDCSRTYSEKSPLLIRGSWYARDVHRQAIDLWQHMGTSLRKTAEWLRSTLGKQGRWQKWYPLEEEREETCHLAASTVHRWLDGAGEEAQRSVQGQLEEVAEGKQLGTDGLWARLRGGEERVVLMLVDSVSGLIWPPIVAAGEGSRKSWARLFERAAEAGLSLKGIEAVTSDGVSALRGYLQEGLSWVHQQRCVWHLWRNLSKKLPSSSEGERGQSQRELVALIHGILDAESYEEAEAHLAVLEAHPAGEEIWKFLNVHLDAALMHLLDCHQGLIRVSPEWCWRDFRQRLSRGRNHGSEGRQERAALMWAIYHNFTPVQRRSEHKRHYRHPGQSALEVAGHPPKEISYLDALGV